MCAYVVHSCVCVRVSLCQGDDVSVFLWNYTPASFFVLMFGASYAHISLSLASMLVGIVLIHAPPHKGHLSWAVQEHCPDTTHEHSTAEKGIMCLYVCVHACMNMLIFAYT